eukprot:CAMPEP_0114993202 /NCGR_PEP_ID=MMETSP0216-20121206/12391_1 /TAXON_ID=223996 /ORGANISM="Protocruzia adherens, Strain Boccale" /LENGTH=231 /DNA_ID=CAMNT_0002356803 /DNA_START=67 /DNA_END=761 /DNA_ORIENTATION=-
MVRENENYFKKVLRYAHNHARDRLEKKYPIIMQMLNEGTRAKVKVPYEVFSNWNDPFHGSGFSNKRIFKFYQVADFTDFFREATDSHDETSLKEIEVIGGNCKIRRQRTLRRRKIQQTSVIKLKEGYPGSQCPKVRSRKNETPANDLEFFTALAESLRGENFEEEKKAQKKEEEKERWKTSWLHPNLTSEEMKSSQPVPQSRDAPDSSGSDLFPIACHTNPFHSYDTTDSK